MLLGGQGGKAAPEYIEVPPDQFGIKIPDFTFLYIPFEIGNFGRKGLTVLPPCFYLIFKRPTETLPFQRAVKYKV